MRRAVLTVALLATLGGRGASASDGFDAQNWKPALDPYGYVTVEGTRSLSALDPHLAVYFDWARNPLKLKTPRPTGGGTEVIKDLSMVDFVAAIGLLDFRSHGGLELSLDVPFAVNENGKRIEVAPGETVPATLPETSWGDVRTAAKFSFLDRKDNLIGLAVRGEVQWPTGDSTTYLSNDRKVTWNVGVALKKEISILRIGVTAAYEDFPGVIHVQGATISEKLKLGGGIALKPFDSIPLEAVGEAFSTVRIGDPWKSQVESPIEVGGAIKYSGKFFALAGANGACNQGIGAAELRIYCAIGFTY